jgi:hypothetical protein
MVTGDDGRRLVQNLRDVARNGLATAFEALERRWPPLFSASRPPVQVTVMGAGGVGKHAIEWAARAGDEARNARLMREGLPGVEVVVVEQNLAGNEAYFRHRFAQTDILVDATARRDTSVPLFPNAWLGLLPAHAVVCDLAVDPYLLDAHPPVVRGIEGIPQGNLDQWEFGPDDPAWDRLPPGIPTTERRTVVSCYSWPGVQPVACMEAYGSQVTPLLKTLDLVRRPAGGLAGRVLPRARPVAGEPPAPAAPMSGMRAASPIRRRHRRGPGDRPGPGFVRRPPRWFVVRRPAATTARALRAPGPSRAGSWPFTLAAAQARDERRDVRGESRRLLPQDEMPGPFVDEEPRVGDDRHEPLLLRARDDVVLRTPGDERAGADGPGLGGRDRTGEARQRGPPDIAPGCAARRPRGPRRTRTERTGPGGRPRRSDAPTQGRGVGRLLDVVGEPGTEAQRARAPGEHEAGDASRVIDGDLLGDVSAARGSHEHGGPDADRIEEGDHVGRDVGEGVAGGGRRGVTVAAQVRRDRPQAPGECRQEPIERVARLGQAWRSTMTGSAAGGPASR